MKKSRVFLVAGAMLLAGIGVFASKARTFATSYYYWNPNLAPASRCVSLGATNPCANLGTMSDCKYDDGTGSAYATYYTTASTACQTPLKYNP